MEQIITDFISKWGYTAIFILILLENVLPVVPSEIIFNFCRLIICEITLIYLDIINHSNNCFIHWFTHFVLYL